MKRVFTSLKNHLSSVKGRMFSLLALTIFFSSSAFAQYCSVYHYYGCGYSNNKLYGAIEEVGFYSNGNELWKKAADGCVDIGNAINSNSHGHTITTVPTFALSYGANFTIKMNGSDQYYSSMSVGIWIDVNRDGDWDDAGDWFGNHSVATSTGGGGSLPTPTEINLSLPCGVTGSGTSRVRIRSTYQGYSYNSGNSCAQGTNPTAVYYGETEDFAVTLQNPSTLAAGFFVVDTAFVKTVVEFKNSNQAGYIYHGWDIGDDGSIEYTTTNASYKFVTAAKNCVRLYSENCLGRDSVIHCVEIVKPTAPPVADFIADKNEVELYNTFKLTDLSTNGAIYWDWFLYQQIDSAGTRIDGDDYPDLRGNDETINRNPELFSAKGIPGFPDVGEWCVGLTSSNDIGPSVTVIKEDYIEVIKGCDVEMGPGTVTGIPGNVITCSAGTIKNKDDGTGNYSSPEANLDALIAPCGAQKITFTFDQWMVKGNMNLKVYDGQDANGIALHVKKGFTATDTPTGPLVANSGALYFIYSTSGSATDKGFLGHWVSDIGTQYPPVADYSVNSVLYNAVESKFTNTSVNATGEVFYTWELDGSVVSTAKDYVKTFLSNKNYSVCLTVETCAGKNKRCKTITVSPITSQTDLDFTADERRPRAGDKVAFESMADKANAFKWNFFPSNSVTFVNGTNANSKNPVVSFSSPGKYTVSLKGWNNLSASDSAVSANQVIKADYVIVISYCIPVVGVTSSADIAINRVLLETTDSPVQSLLDSKSEESTYTDYLEEFPAPRLTFGGSYDITLERKSTKNKVTRRVWIDYNIDGDFEDVGEMVLSEAPANTSSYTERFTVPDLKKSFEGKTRMRVATGYDNDPNVPCGATSGIKNANRIGEFEDYSILLSNDFTVPTITLNGADTAYVELGKTYTDAGASANDPTEGDITVRMDTTSDVDASAAGIYYVTYNVSDASGNAANEVVRVVIVVVDQSPPTITLLGTNPYYVEVITGTYQEDGATATDATDGNLTTAIVVSGTVNTFKIGTYNVTYTVQDVQGNIATGTRTVIVRDQVFPTINNDDIKVISGRNVVQVQIQSVFVDRTIPADNYNNGTFGPLFSYSISPANAQGEADVDTRSKGTTIVNYTAEDETGNKTELIVDYVVEDFIAPIISLNTLDTVYHTVNAKYVAVEASVSDNFYDNTQVSLTRISNVNPYKLGLYTDTYTATDASGNETVKSRFVRVLDNSKPMISGKFGNIIRLGLFSNVGLVNYLTMTDNYDAPSVLFSNVRVLSNDLNVYEEGIYAAVFETFDNSGNVSDPFTLIIDVNRNYTSFGVNDAKDVELMSIYPNPSNGIFNVAINLPSNENTTLAVYDMMGSKIADIASETLQNGNFVVDLTGMASGVYFVKMNVQGKVFTQRIVLN
jgi:PKD repeat protein